MSNVSAGTARLNATPAPANPTVFKKVRRLWMDGFVMVRFYILFF
jgi:hypothetical protein